MGGEDYDHHPDRTWIEGTGYQDPPEDRPTKRASDSIGRQQRYGESGLKDGGILGGLFGRS